MPKPSKLDALKARFAEEEAQNPFAQWIDCCPECEEPLFVSRYTLTATGETVTEPTRLFIDGFIVDAPDSLKDQSTEEEMVTCSACDFQAPLADLLMERVTPPA